VSRIQSIRLEHIKKILSGYDLKEPFHHYLNSYFRQNRQMGSKDRKLVRQYCYYWFRLGKACMNDPFELRLLKAIFLCSSAEDELFNHLHEHYELKAERSLSIMEKLKWLGIGPADIFPLIGGLSSSIAKEAFLVSLFEQPQLWLRARSGYEKQLEAKLRADDIPFKRHDEIQQAYALPNGSAAETAGLAEVQDLSSQKAIALAQPQAKDRVWDCCAASGGKSLALYDRCPDISLYVSDKRENILINLKQRFSTNGIEDYSFGSADLEMPLDLLKFISHKTGSIEPVSHGFFDIILADVPCSGSGTWSRMPEQIAMFGRDDLDRYVGLQRKIIDHALAFLKAGGQLIYITCSVFAAENELQAEYLSRQHGLELIRMEHLCGYTERADNLFTAIFRKAS
jgi:16S rRNA (cytosine967-C5)-methyltransferase